MIVGLGGRRSLAAVTVVGTVLALSVVIAAASDAEDDPGYSITIHDVRDAVSAPGGRERAIVDFSYSWPTSTYPGARDCVFRIYSADGEMLGEETQQLAGMSATKRISAEIPIRSGSPSSATIECGRPRSDDPRGRFTFRSLAAESNPTTGWLDITADVSWSGSSTSPPAAQVCLLTLYDRQGNTVATQDFHLLVMEPTKLATDAVITRINPESFDATRVSRAAASCRPLSE